MVISLSLFPSLRFWVFSFLSFLVLCPSGALGLVNVTVERGDPQISYGPKFAVEWKEGWPGVMKSSGAGAEATFTFTGTTLFYEGWSWSIPTMFQAQIDDQMPITIDLTDQRSTGDRNSTGVPTTPKTILLWRMFPGDRAETSHTILFSKIGDQREIIIGKLIYSTDNPPPTVSPGSFAPNTSTFPQPSAAAAAQSTTANLRIILPSIFGGILVLGLVAGIIACYVWKRRHPRVRFDVPIVTKTTVAQDRPQMKNNGSSISLARATRGLVDQVWDPRIIHVRQVDKAPHPNWQIE